MHHFPYGQWNPNFDSGSGLLANPAASPTAARYAYAITLDKVNTSLTSVSALFSDAVAKGAFTYLTLNNPVIDFTNPGIRVISLPIPTQIITADFPPGSTITSNPPSQLVHGAGTCDNSGTPCGLAAAHIFDYQGASQLSYQGNIVINGARTGAESDGWSADFHIHTVPNSAPLPGHAVQMFQNLLGLIKGFNTSQVTLTIPHPKADPLEGPFVPTCVGDPELDIPYDSARTGNTASCAGGGVGVKGGG
jgi:hypothetical protein